MHFYFPTILFSVFFATFAFVGQSVASEKAPATGDDAQMRVVGFCSSCHGEGGVSRGESIPSIGGQTQEYLIISTNEMKDKLRRATLMQKIAQGYSIEEINTIGNYFSKLKWKPSDNKLDAKLVAEGKKMSGTCSDCHVNNGAGEGETPRIAGQNAKYLYNALLEYKHKSRNNDAGGAMMADAVNIDDKSLKALAEYYSSLK